ncbi:hypothetical protein HOK51_03695 [Candidatus Woesearchaeota archaeon]|jgi:hypothetical protein|nr:hypothetical protein [Candidatus Woesearchaeota archaeon]MBT6518925.1 hypothetical protein [Candidatus Woesearchaeota archaeon]MBT7367593.1 hypothetical protein [Candidatus Woesearchaeota archaeon]
MNNLKEENLESKLKRSAWSQIKSGTVKGLKISYGLAVAAGIGYLIFYEFQQDDLASKNQACQEMKCSSAMYFECEKRVSEKEDADHCVINSNGEEECCICSCYYTGG